jgi:hypothetical protein
MYIKSRSWRTVMHQKIRNGWKENKFLCNKNKKTTNGTLLTVQGVLLAECTILASATLLPLHLPFLAYCHRSTVMRRIFCTVAGLCEQCGTVSGYTSNLRSQFLGAFAKLWKATIRFATSVCPHGTSQLHWTDFHEIGYLSILGKSVDKFQV